MTCNEAGRKLIQEFEGCSLTVYKDANRKAVGWGHQTDLPLGTKVTQAQADLWFAEDVARIEGAIAQLIKWPMNENQFSALVSFAYNEGPDKLRTSTLLRCVNAGHPFDAAEEFARWNKSQGKILDGLTRRRRAEKALFLLDIGL